MNAQIRKLLIDGAINDRPVYYGEIMKLLELKGGFNEDHFILSQTLADISRFEKVSGRPLLSSIATYSPQTSRRKKGETHGNGFFELAEELGCGNRSKLKNDMFALEEMTRCREYWRVKDHYSQFYEVPNGVPLEREKLTDFVIDMVNKTDLSNCLVKRDPPMGELDKLPILSYSFEGADIDWDLQVNLDIETGAIGEELVVEYEKKRLLDAGLYNYAEEVIKQKDGAGFDIFSRNLDGSPKMIEVKTTTGIAQTPFCISITEIVFSSQNPESYVLYRLYNLEKDRRIAEFYECEGDLHAHFLFEGVNFKAHKRK